MSLPNRVCGLRESGLVEAREEARPIGRPAKLWRLTGAADALFPDGHADLTLDLIQSIRTAFGDDGMDRLLEIRAARQSESYDAAIGDAKTIRSRLNRLAKLRTAEGYMATVEKDTDGNWLLVENHCPICAAASACTGICAAELDIFRNALGDDVAVERTDHIPAGARRCASRVTSRKDT